MTKSNELDQNELDQSDIEFLISTPLFIALSGNDGANTLIHFNKINLSDNECLFDSGSIHEKVYIIRNGQIDVDKNNVLSIRTSGFLGEELVLGSKGYISSAISNGSSTVYAISIGYITDLINSSRSVKQLFFDSFNGIPQLNEIENNDLPTKENKARSNSNQSFILQVVGWLLVIATPLLILKFGSSIQGLNQNAIYFLGLLMSTVMMWIFNLTPAFVPPLFSIIGAIIFDIVPASVALAGFASDGFFMLLSIFAIGALMVMSGLTYRISLVILRIVPANTFWYNLALFLYGLVLTPILPSQLGRGVIVTPFLSSLIETTGRKKNNLAVAQLITSAISGISLMAATFLTGKPANLIVYSLMDVQTQFAFSWLPWLYSASFTGAVILILYLTVSTLYFRKAPTFSISYDVVRAQQKMLGPITPIEWSALVAILFVMVGILTVTYHRVEIPWFSMTILMALLIFGSLSKEDINNKVDWTTLIFIGSIVTWVPIIRMTGIDVLITQNFGGLGVYMKTYLPLFILGLCGAIVVIRLALPELVTEIMLVTLLLPVANVVGISSWLIGFVILTMAESYIFPYQAPYHLQMQNLLLAKNQGELYEERKIIVFNVLMILVKVIAISVSLPFWKYINVI
jgi:DASS family divalent anion:Na+ symporter